MDEQGKMSENLLVKVRAFLDWLAIEAIGEADEPELLTESEIQALADRTLHELSVDRRVLLHAEAWISDVGEYAQRLAHKAVNNKLKRAAAAGRTRDAGREF